MDFRDKVFLSVAENRSFSKAAEELLISQPAITRHIKELEGRTQTALFERKGNRIYLTAAGQLMYSHLKKIRQNYRELDFELSQLNNTYKGELRIGASSTISQYVIPKVLAAFHKCYPTIELYLLNGNSFEMEQKLLAQEVDLALVENESSRSEIKYLNFLDDEIIAVSSNQSIYAKIKNISPADLPEIPLVLREKGSGTLEVIKKSLQRNNIELDRLNLLMHLGSTEAIKNFLTDFEGIALVSEKAVEKELQRNELVKLNIKGIELSRKFRLALLQGNESQAPNLFLQFLLAYNF